MHVSRFSFSSHSCLHQQAAVTQKGINGKQIEQSQPLGFPRLLFTGSLLLLSAVGGRLIAVNGKAKLIAAVPALFLLVVASVQIYLVHSGRLTPWKGGGFGMFSTTDGNMFRSLRVFVSAPNRSEELLLKGNLEELAVRAQMFPSDGLLRKVAVAVLKDQRKKGLPAEKIEIDVWNVEFDAGDLRPHSKILRRYSYNAGAE